MILYLSFMQRAAPRLKVWVIGSKSALGSWLNVTKALNVDSN